MIIEKSSFLSFDGTKINLVHLIPDHIKVGETPAVLFQPGNRCTADDYLWLLEPLCQAGYLVYGIYQRGYGSGEDGVNDRGGSIQQEDMKIALNQLKENNLVDHTRIACVGHSNGGHMVQRLAVDNKFKCGVAMSQICDWAIFVGSCKDYLPDYYAQATGDFGGGPVENPQPYIDRSCLHLAEHIQMPILAVAGGDDTTTPLHLSRLMYEALRHYGNNMAEFVIIPGAGHFYERYGFNGYLTREVAEVVVNWLKKTL